MTHKIIANDEACEGCKEKFENDELAKCDRCGRLEDRHSLNIRGKYICDCIRYNEEIEEKELPSLPHERREATFYERQINSLREEKGKLTEEVETHLEALEISEDWHKRQKQELLDKIKQQEAEIERLKKITPQGLINEVEAYKKEVIQLKNQFENLNSRQSAQIEASK
jgi:hypothetical protein